MKRKYRTFSKYEKIRYKNFLSGTSGHPLFYEVAGDLSSVGHGLKLGDLRLAAFSAVRAASMEQAA